MGTVTSHTTTSETKESEEKPAHTSMPGVRITVMVFCVHCLSVSPVSEARPQFLRQFLDILGLRHDDILSSKLVEDQNRQSYLKDRQFRARKVDTGTQFNSISNNYANNPVQSNYQEEKWGVSQGEPTPNCVCRCECCPCCPCKEEEGLDYQYVDK